MDHRWSRITGKRKQIIAYKRFKENDSWNGVGGAHGFIVKDFEDSTKGEDYVVLQTDESFWIKIIYKIKSKISKRMTMMNFSEKSLK